MDIALHVSCLPHNRDFLPGPQVSAIVLLFLLPLLDPLSSLCDSQPIWARRLPIEPLCTCCSPLCIRQRPFHTLDQSPCSPPKHRLLLDHLHPPPARTVRHKVSSHLSLIDVITRALRLADLHICGTLPERASFVYHRHLHGSSPITTPVAVQKTDLAEIHLVLFPGFTIP